MDYWQRMQHHVADLVRGALGNMVRPATVTDVKGDKIRCIIGYDMNGQPVKSPWLGTSNFRGGARERRFFGKPSEQQGQQGQQGGAAGLLGGLSPGGSSTGGIDQGGGGQNVILLCPTGDLRQAVVLPFGPNINHMPPDHANKTGLDEEVWQLGNIRVKKNRIEQQQQQQGGGLRATQGQTGQQQQKSYKHSYTIWMQPPQQQQQQQGEVKKLPERDSDADPDKATMVLRINEDGGITGRVGKDVRFSAHQNGAKVKAGSNYCTITKDKSMLVAASGKAHVKAAGDAHVHTDANLYARAGGTPFVNKPWQLKDKPSDASDSVADDNKLD